MAVYTCFDMVRDCRADRPEGWEHLISEYLPFCRAVMDQYVPERASDLDALQTLLAILKRPDCPILDVPGTTPEREFLLGLRKFVLEQMQPAIPQQTAPAAARLNEVSALERQIAWLETMKYDDRTTARMMHIDQQTVGAARQKVRDALGGSGLEGVLLMPRTEECATPRLLADYMDGRVTWIRREEVDLHLGECWRCVDLFCRVRELDHLMRSRRPLASDEADRLRRALGIEQPRTSFWQKVLSVGWN